MSTRLLKRTLPPLPADVCPYVTGRAGGFERCPAFRAAVAVPIHPRMADADVYTHEPAPVVTCAYLAVGEADDGRFYPRCRIGTPAARRRFARGMRGARRRTPDRGHARPGRRIRSALGGRLR